VNKINWIRTGMQLRAEGDHGLWPSNPGWGLNEQDMDPVQHWCWETGIGKRMSFDTFQFKTEKEITMFLLRWA